MAIYNLCFFIYTLNFKYFSTYLQTHCDEYCYCPMLGSCQMYSFVIPLHGLIANDTDTGDHNRHYHFMFTVMNDAHLETVDKVGMFLYQFIGYLLSITHSCLINLF